MLQASSSNLQGYFTGNYASSERTAIQTALGIPSADLPLFIFSAGTPATGIEEERHDGAGAIEITPNPFRDRVSIRLDAGARTREASLQILDSAGRRVRSFSAWPVTPGTIVWDGRDSRGRQVPRGTYLCVLKTAGQEYRKHVVKL